MVSETSRTYSEQVSSWLRNRLRSLLSISSLFSVVFMCLILPTLKFILGKSAKITKNEVSQDFMRFYSYEPLVETIL